MKRILSLKMTFLAALLLLAPFIFYEETLAHCDTMDGPVIAAAKEALKTGKVEPVLSWVQPADEEHLRTVFEKTHAVRKLSPEASDFADTYFFETLVRVHRAGEGAPYTGLKPAGQVEPAVAAADKSIETGSAERLVRELMEAVSRGVNERFKYVVEKKAHASHNVQSGREFVAAYVDFIHYVERLHEDAGAEAHGRGSGTAHEHK